MWIYIKTDGSQTEFREWNASQEVHCQQNSTSQQKPYTLLSAFFCRYSSGYAIVRSPRSVTATCKSTLSAAVTAAGADAVCAIPAVCASVRDDIGGPVLQIRMWKMKRCFPVCIQACRWAPARGKKKKALEILRSQGLCRWYGVRDSNPRPFGS